MLFLGRESPLACPQTDHQAAPTEVGLARDFGVSKEVTILAISLYIMEVFGRNTVYRLSYAAFFSSAS